jgi:hypothetical protein
MEKKTISMLSLCFIEEEKKCVVMFTHCGDEKSIDSGYMPIDIIGGKIIWERLMEVIGIDKNAERIRCDFTNVENSFDKAFFKAGAIISTLTMISMFGEGWEKMIPNEHVKNIFVGFNTKTNEELWEKNNIKEFKNITEIEKEMRKK